MSLRDFFWLSDKDVELLRSSLSDQRARKPSKRLDRMIARVDRERRSRK